MGLVALKCPSCGAKEIVRSQGRFACGFCGTRIVPRLEPGTLCGDDSGSGFCTDPALTLCRRCARPLCDRHNAPRRYYWHEPLGWRVLVPGWTARDASDWSRLNAPFQRFPVRDFEPFEWIPHDRRSQYAIGQIEERIAADLQPIVRDGGGMADEQCCAFESLCNECEGELTGQVDEVVRGYSARYRRAAFRERLDALAAEAKQALAYVEAFLGRPLARKPPETDDDRVGELGTDSPRQDWDAWGHRILARLAVIDRLRDRLESDRRGQPDEDA